MGTGRGGASSARSAVFEAWRRSRPFAAVEVASSESALIGADGSEVTRTVGRVTPGTFDLLGGVRPVRGRLFDPSDGRPGSNHRVLLSEDDWRTLYSADPSIVGRSITINGQPMLIVGVLPRDFSFPTWNTTVWRAASFTGPAERSTRGTVIDRVFTKPIHLTPGVRGIARLRITGSDWRQPVAVEFVVTLQGRRIYEFAEKDAFLPENHVSQESFPECRGFVSCKQQYYNTLLDFLTYLETARYDQLFIPEGPFRCSAILVFHPQLRAFIDILLE